MFMFVTVKLLYNTIALVDEFLRHVFIRMLLCFGQYGVGL